MPSIDPDSPLGEKIFRDWTRFADGEFVSKLPSAAMLAAGMNDPSLALQGPAATAAFVGQDGTPFQGESFYSAPMMARLQGETLHSALMFATYNKVQSSQPPGTAKNGGTLTAYLPFIRNVYSNLDLAGIEDMAGFRQRMLGSAVGFGVSALSAIPTGWSQIVAAVIAIGYGIYAQVRRSKNEEAMEEEERKREAWLLLPALQGYHEDIDNDLINKYIRRDYMEGADWSGIFMPRFRGNWLGIKRQNGYAFAPGAVLEGEDLWGNPMGVFAAPTLPGTNKRPLGVVPGMQRMTSIVQVGELRPGVTSNYQQGAGPWPFDNPRNVSDVGDYYPATAQLCTALWQMAEKAGSPDMYKIDTGIIGPAWKEYVYSGIEFLRDNVTYAKTRDHERYIYAAAIGNILGTWRCVVEGGSKDDPLYGTAEDLLFYRDVPSYARPDTGTIARPGTLDIKASTGKLCFGNIYDDYIKPALDNFYARQRAFLRKSLASAYVRSDFAAFQGPPASRGGRLREDLFRWRAELYKSQDRFRINMADVPKNDPDQVFQKLVASGVPLVATPTLSLAAQPTEGDLDPEGEHAPAPLPPGGGLPLGIFVPTPGRPTGTTLREILRSAALLGVAGGGAYLAKRYGLLGRRA